MTAVAQSLTWTQRNLVLLWREPRTWIAAVAAPTVFFLGFYAVLARLLEAEGVDYAQYLPPAIAVQALLFTAMGTGFWAAEDAAGGMLARARSLPIARVSVVAGRLAADLARALVAIAVVVGLGVAFGFGFAGPAGAVGFVALALLFCATLGAGCAWVGLALADGERTVSLLNLPYLPLFMLSTALVPAQRFPGWLEPVIEQSPVSRTIDAMRALADGAQSAEPVAIALAWLAGLLVVFGAGAARALGRAT